MPSNLRTSAKSANQRIVSSIYPLMWRHFAIKCDDVIYEPPGNFPAFHHCALNRYIGGTNMVIANTIKTMTIEHGRLYNFESTHRVYGHHFC